MTSGGQSLSHFHDRVQSHLPNGRISLAHFFHLIFFVFSPHFLYDYLLLYYTLLLYLFTSFTRCSYVPNVRISSTHFLHLIFFVSFQFPISVQVFPPFYLFFTLFTPFTRCSSLLRDCFFVLALYCALASSFTSLLLFLIILIRVLVFLIFHRPCHYSLIHLFILRVLYNSLLHPSTTLPSSSITLHLHSPHLPPTNCSFSFSLTTASCHSLDI